MGKLTDKLKKKKTNNKNTTIQKDKKFSNIKIFLSGIPSRFNNFCKKIAKKKNMVTLITVSTIVLLCFSILCVSIGFKSFFNKYESKEIKISNDDRKYIQVDEDTSIVEEMIIEVGDVLPDITEYFSDDSKIDDDATMLYYKDNEILSVEDFTHEIDGILYVNSVMRITVVITNGDEYEVDLIIEDNTPPKVTLKDLTIKKGEYVDAYMFIDTYEDNSFISVYNVNFDGDFDYSEVGDYEVALVVCDTFGNCLNLNGKLSVVEETQNNDNDSDNDKDNDKDNDTQPEKKPEQKPEDPKPKPDPDPKPEPDPDPKPEPEPDPVDIELEAMKKHFTNLKSFFRTSSETLVGIKSAYKTNLSKVNPDLKIDDTLTKIAELRVIEIAEYQNGTALKDQNGVESENGNHIRYNGKKFSTFIEDYDKVNGTSIYSDKKAYGEIYLNGRLSITSVNGAFTDEDGWLASEGHRKILENKAYKNVGVARYISKNGCFHYLIIFSS